jgi:predicted DNA-binding ribbon-helix-helix protein
MIRLPQTESKKNTTNKTFRLDRSKFDSLARAAKQRNVSPNEVVTELIAEDLDKEHFLSALKMLRVSSLMLKLITEAVPDEKIIEIGERLANDVLQRNLPFEVAGDLSKDSILKTMKYFAGAHSYEFSEAEHEGKKVVILAHYVGRSYSLLIATYWESLLASIGVNVSFLIDDSAVVLKFEKTPS